MSHTTPHFTCPPYIIYFQRRRQGSRKVVAPGNSSSHIDSFSESRVASEPPTNTSTPNKPELSSHDSNIVPVQNDAQYAQTTGQSQALVPVEPLEGDQYNPLTEPTHRDHNYLPNQPEVLKYSSNNEIIPNIMMKLTSDISLAEQLSSEINKVCQF